VRAYSVEDAICLSDTLIKQNLKTVGNGESYRIEGLKGYAATGDLKGGGSRTHKLLKEATFREKGIRRTEGK